MWFRGSSCAGICFETDKYFCYHPYSDGDKICNNSRECEGLCIIDSEKGIKLIEELGEGSFITCENCTGRCEIYPAGNYKVFFEFNKPNVIAHNYGIIY